ncbi:uncharacterized protein LOC100175024 [Ciona intestinalis]
MRFGLIVALIASVLQFSVVYSQSCSTLQCTQKCDSTSTPPKCTCFTGYELQSDGKTCLDINECQRSSSLCTANDAPLCRNTEGSYICTGCGADSNITWQYYKRPECCKIDTTATCGKSTSTSGRIVGGTAARISNWPWTAYLSIGGDACGGTLIASNLVLTTAHCIQNVNPSQVTVTLGVSNFLDTSNVHRQTFSISKFERHPDFDSLRLQNDVAILWLSTPAIIGLYVAPICMPNGQVPPDGEKCWTTGYGSLAEGGSTPQPLQEVDVPIVNVHTCAAVYQSFTQKVIPSTMVCAGYQQGGKDACQGDSGGPLVCQRCDSCSWYLAGITVFGRGCGRANSYGVYTKISAFESWIASKTQLSHVVKPCTLPSKSFVHIRIHISLLHFDTACLLYVLQTCFRQRVGYEYMLNQYFVQACNTQACGTWGAWVWGDCSVTCGGGTRTGARICDTKGGTTVCVGTSSLTGVCGAAQCVDSTCKDKLTDCDTLSSLCQQTAYVSLMRDICPQTCGLCGGSSWSGWTNDGTCSVACGTGVQKQIRTCNGGTAGTGGCAGSATQTIACNVHACPPQGSWSGWSNSGDCTLTCGGGTQQQIRTCTGGTAGTGGCPGSATQTIACNEQACPSVGSWGSWVNSGSCSKMCGTGAQQQTRTCNGGTPGVGGCPGSATQSIPCNQHACPVLGSWGSWINSGTCSVSCMQQQTRSCIGGTAGQGGCLGSTTQSVSCTGGSCQPQTGCQALIDQTITSTCVSYASLGYCDIYVTYMQNNCAKTCCMKRAGGCLDVDLDASCPSKKDSCHLGTVQAFCKKTCNPACNTKK